MKQHTEMYERNVLGPLKSNGEMFSSDLRGTAHSAPLTPAT